MCECNLTIHEKNRLGACSRMVVAFNSPVCINPSKFLGPTGPGGYGDV